MRLLWNNCSRNLLYTVIAVGLVWCGSTALAEDLNKDTAAATADSTPRPQIDGVGTIARPKGNNLGLNREAQFVILGVANDQTTAQFFAGAFIYVDRKSHISFVTDKIETVTINGDQGAFTGTARVGGPRNKQTVQFMVTVTANQALPSDNTFSIVLSNGYTASGNLTGGKITIRTVDPD